MAVAVAAAAPAAAAAAAQILADEQQPAMDLIPQTSLPDLGYDIKLELPDLDQQKTMDSWNTLSLLLRKEVEDGFEEDVDDFRPHRQRVSSTQGSQ
eukprot:m.132225 g.132225  ORF g.132225 m.132225 type:complete len:96 (-) comp20056_c1_seq1:23-310(-)